MQMSSIAATSCNVPVCDVDELARAHLASDESTEADSGAEESPPGPRVAAGRSSPTAGTAASRAASLAAAGARPGAAASASWQLIWCHERCHKKECETRKNIFIKDAEEYKASLLCLKKAAKYAAWLEQAQRPPHALLTDWREVKPCLQASGLHAFHNQPVFTVILCDLPKHYERASAWAQGLPARHNPVRICADVGLLRGMLQELTGQLLAGAAARSRPLQGPPGQFNSAARPSPQHAMTQATGYGNAPWTANAEDDMEKEYEAIRKQRDSMWLQAVSCLVPAWGVTGRSPLVATGISGVDHCSYLQVQSIAAPQSPASPYVDLTEDSPQQLEAMLMRAMPDHYDD